MAYFSNGSEGMCLDEQCMECRYGTKPCPIFNLQLTYNYKQVGNKLAEKILNDLIKNDGSCEMFREFESDLRLTEDEKNQLEFESDLRLTEDEKNQLEFELFG